MFYIYCTTFPSNIVFFFNEPNAVGCYRNEIQMLSKLYVDTELTVTLLEHDTFRGLLRLFYCFAPKRLLVADAGLLSGL